METLKLGSKGEAVKKLQAVLGLTQDGIFGPKTEAALKARQAVLGLSADGIAGPKTLAALKVSEPSKAVADWVIYDPLNVHLYERKNRTVKYIVIHYTESGNSKPGRAKSTKHTFETRPASADFCVDDRDVVQFNPDLNNYATWQCGGSKYSGTRGAAFFGKCVNSNSIGVEMCSFNDGGTFTASNHDKWGVTEQVLANTTRLVKLLMKKYNIPVERVIRHWDVSGKLCPGIVGWNDDNLRNAKTGAKLPVCNHSHKWEAWKKTLVE